MAQLAAATDLASYDDLIDPHFIGAAVNYAVQTPFLYNQIANMIDIRGASSRAYTHVVAARMAAAAAVAESDEAAVTEITTAESVLTAAIVGRAAFLTREAASASKWGAAALTINTVANAQMLKADTDVVGLSSSMSNSQGDNAVVHDITNHTSVMTAVRAQFKNARSIGMVLHPDAARDLLNDSQTSGAPFFSTQFGESIARAMAGVSQGFMSTTVDNVSMFISDRVPTADTSGWGNFAFDMMNNPLGMVVKAGVRVEPRIPDLRFGIYYLGSADYGVGILEQARCYEFITRT